MANGLDITAERRAILGLWSVPGIGPKSIRAIEARVGLAEVLRTPVAEWLGEVALGRGKREALLTAPPLFELADGTLERARAGGIGVAFPGDPAYPALLAEIDDAPPLLFHLGTPGGPRRRLAMVGTRHPETGFLIRARRFARDIAATGVGIVSGAAEGVDTACHHGALDAGGETWAFLGSALDQIDSAQRGLMPRVLEGNGVYFSELPPGVRADRTTFPRRNRLISGSSDAVLVLRAGRTSGALHTSDYARAQGRPVLVMAGDGNNPKAEGTNLLLRDKLADLCIEPADACKAVGAVSYASGPPPPGERHDLGSLSLEAQAAYEAVERTPLAFEELLAKSRVGSGALSAALCELELVGLVVQRPGRRYERI